MNNLKFITDRLKECYTLEYPNAVGIDSICAITSEKITKGYRKSEIISSTFNNWEIFRNESEFVSEEVYLCLKDCIVRNDNLSGLRNYSFYATEKGIKLLKHGEIIEIIKGKKEIPFILGVTQSGQKHIAIKTKLNYSNDDYIVRTEAGDVNIIQDNFLELYEVVQNRYTEKPDSKMTYFTKEEILFGRPSYKKIENYGIDKYFKEENIINKYRKTNLLTFTIQILRKENEKN